jgi:hypothetical protein
MFFTTITGRHINLSTFSAADIDIVDIAHGLSLICRFNGQCKEFYSVAQHCLRVADLVPEKFKLTALLHDAAEAYVCDMTKPAKTLFPNYAEFEKRILSEILYVYGLPPTLPQIVREADTYMLRLEMTELFPCYEGIELPRFVPQNKILFNHEPETPPVFQARALFLTYFHTYSRRSYESRTNTQGDQCSA